MHRFGRLRHDVGAFCASRKGTYMDCSVAIQVLPLDRHDDASICAVVDEVINALAASGLPYEVGPFETTIEGSYDACMEVLRSCQLIAAQAGCEHVLTYAKINYRPNGDVMSTEQKVAPYRRPQSAHPAPTA